MIYVEVVFMKMETTIAQVTEIYYASVGKQNPRVQKYLDGITRCKFDLSINVTKSNAKKHLYIRILERLFHYNDERVYFSKLSLRKVVS